MPDAEAEPGNGFKPRACCSFLPTPRVALLQPSYKQQSVSLLIAPKMWLFCFLAYGGNRGRHGLAMLVIPYLAEEAVFCPTKHLLLPVT